MEVNISRFRATLGAYSEQELLQLYLGIEDELDARTLAAATEDTKIHLRSGTFMACRAWSTKELVGVFNVAHVNCGNCRNGRKARLIRDRRRSLSEAAGA